MNLIKNLNEEMKGSTVVGLGYFDGIHLGHQYLLERLVESSKEYKIPNVLFTFNNSIAHLIDSHKTEYLLVDNREKVRLLREIGIDNLFMVNFNEYIQTMTAKEFIKNIIVDKLNAKKVIVGFNYTFGYKGSGDTDYLKALGQEFDFDVEVIEPVKKYDKVISSSSIKKLISQGKIEKANALLGRPYEISGKVIKGRGRGKGMGFATANLKLRSNFVIPKFGVYKTWSKIDNKYYLSITNVGENPTFNDKGVNIETHIFDIVNELYDKNISIRFEKFIREERKFDNKEDLIKQVKKDIEIVRYSK
ncbi:bifunctional riboflavin kinase/FAD synthetase [Dethiothermospora halolimnae]|uniref:bifunctional riboflavin kinase/FAD synthetase n=1 Tax=Dethiothermospora halolimnae TaxID=3114390 RepID=UPI003CCB7849